MRIAFDEPALLKEGKTGIAWSAHHLVSALAGMQDMDCQFNYFASDCPEDSRDILKEYQDNGIRLNPCRWLKGKTYRHLWPFLPVPYSCFFGSDSQITQFFNYSIPPGVKGRKVTIVYDMSYKACPDTVRERTKIWLELTLRPSCQRADMIVTISEFSKREIIRYLDIVPEKIVVMPCAADHTRFRADISEVQIENVKKKYGFSGEYFLYLGTIEPRKNIQRIIDAYAGLKKKYRDAPRLVLAGGKGWKCDSVYESVRELHMPKDILFTGYVSEEDAPPLMAGAKAFLFPSLYEGFGIPVIEAMACGTPVITSNTSSLPEVAGDAGLLVDPYSEEEMSRAMEKLMLDEGLCQELSAKGVDRARRFTWEHSAGILRDVYRELEDRGDGD